MDEMNFGDVLRQAREQSGEDLVSVARRIRIRPDILERIEESDIDAMPPRGYSRNMINAYARYLGLNTTEVVKMYQNAQYRKQVEHARENMQSTGFDIPSTRRAAVHEREHANETGHMSRSRAAIESSRQASTSSSRTSSSSRRSSNGFDDALFDDIDAAIAPPKESDRRFGAVHVGSYNAYGQGLSRRNANRSSGETRRLEAVDDAPRRDARGTHKARRSNMPGEHYTNLYAAPKNIGVHVPSWRDKLPFIIAGVVVLLLVVVIAVFANGLGRAATNEPASTPINVTGLPGSTSETTTEETTTEDSSSSDSSTSSSTTTNTTSETAPTKTVMAYEIPSGVSTYFEVYIDGSYVDGGNVTGPQSESYDVTGDFEFRVTPPDGVVLTQDGTEIALEAGSSGVATVKVSFADVLAKWNEEHSSSSSSTTTSSTTGTTTTTTTTSAQ